MQSIQNQLTAFREKGRRFKRWKKIVTALACVVVFCTVYALILPAITLESDSYCGKEEHEHSEECYKEVVVSTEKRLICSKEEVEPHTHTDACYEIREVEVQVEEIVEVPVEEEEAEDETSETSEEEQLATVDEISEEEQSAAVSESSEASETRTVEPKTKTVIKTEIQEEKVLVCETEETEGHAHADECYEEVEVPGEKVLDCEMEEHKHSKICYSNPEADIETEADWKKTFEDVTFTNDWVEDTLAIAKTQLGYTESNDNYIILENGDCKGYSRYGDWYGNKYGDWCAMFVSFCLDYAQVEDFPLEAGCQNWILKMKDIEEASKDKNGVVQYNAWQEATDDYIPERGNIIFFNWDAEADSDHVGIVVSTTTDADGNITITTIEGNASDTVKYKEYASDNGTIMGYGILPAQEFYCGMKGHAHDEDCYDDANELICGAEEHIHATECEEKKEIVEEDLSERVKRVIELIDKLPAYEEFEAKLLEYEDAEDMDGYEKYYMEVSGQAFGTYVRYEELNEEKQEITNAQQHNKDEIDAKIADILNLMKHPYLISPKFNERMHELASSMTKLKLPKTISRDFFIELSGAEACICGRNLGEKERKFIIINAESYLGSDQQSVLNAIKSSLNSSEYDDRLENAYKQLKVLREEENRLQTRANNNAEKLLVAGGEEAFRLKEQIDALGSQIAVAKSKLELIESKDETNEELDENNNIHRAEMVYKDYEQKIATATRTSIALKRKEAVEELLVSIKAKATLELKKEIIRKANEKIKEVIKDDDIEIEEIDKYIKLRKRDGASEGQTLGIAYCFLGTLFQDAELEFPFVIDSPTGKMDFDKRQAVADIIPSVFNQMIAFVQSAEVDHFANRFYDRADTQFVTIIASKAGDDVEVHEGKEFFDSYQRENKGDE